MAQIAAKSRNTGASPLLFHEKCPGLHYTTALRPIRRTKQLWLSVLLKDTSAATGQAGIRTHILTTPELESNARDRSATSLHSILVTCVYILNNNNTSITAFEVWDQQLLLSAFKTKLSLLRREGALVSMLYDCLYLF